MAELVIADAPFKTYPGGMIVLRAIDWLGPSRGTLTTMSDSRSIIGTVVVDTQQITPTFLEYLNADDTLVIPLSEIPIEEDVIEYQVAFSYIIEGDWNPDVLQTMKYSTQSIFGGCELCFKTQFSDGGTNRQGTINHRIRKSPYYVIAVSSSLSGFLTSTQTLKVKASSEVDSTISWRLDQVYLLPYRTTTGSPWSRHDFAITSGGQSQNKSFYFTADDFGDGLDGGDANGKFTIKPFRAYGQPAPWAEWNAGGDYQRKASEEDAEYLIRMRGEEDYYTLYDSRDFSEPKSSHCYGIHGVDYIASQDWVTDNFDRIIGSSELGDYGDPEGAFESNESWGSTPEGFKWIPHGLANFGPGDFYAGFGSYEHRHGVSRFVDGEKAGILIAYESVSELEAGCLLVGPGNETPILQVDDFIMSGEVYVDQIEAGHIDPETGCKAVFGTGRRLWNPDRHAWWFEWNTFTQEVGLAPLVIPPGESYPYWRYTEDTTGWEGVGFKYEHRRFLHRAKLWDTAGSEPTEWTFSEFRPLFSAFSPFFFSEYPYDDIPPREDLDSIPFEGDRHHFYFGQVTGDHRKHGIHITYLKNFKVSHDLGSGTISPTHYSMEIREGNKVDEITLPANSQHFVYWGKRDWTITTFGDSVLDFSHKAWNEPGAPDLQRAETLQLVFRSTHPEPAIIVPMHWRYGTKPNRAQLSRR